MAANTVTEKTTNYNEILNQSIDLLQEQISSILSELKSIPEIRTSKLTTDAESIEGFLQTLRIVSDTMSEDRLRETLRNAMQSIERGFDQLSRGRLSPEARNKISTIQNKLNAFSNIRKRLGPVLHISKDEMSAWIIIDSEGGQKEIYTVASIIENLTSHGIVHGHCRDRIEEALRDKKYEVEILAAKGQAPVAGKDGKVIYHVDVDEFSHVPTILANGKAAFKDIHLFSYVKQGDLLAELSAASAGQEGQTVTGRIVHPIDGTEAEFPDCPNTSVSNGGICLIADVDGCLTKKNGRLDLEPCLQVNENVSYQTGNIDSTVSVVVKGDVLAGFSVRSEKDIFVNSVVEGGHMESKGDIVVKGGIEGKGQSTIESNGNVTAKYIKNATVTAMQDISVQAGIIQSSIWAGGCVSATGSDAVIVGGEVIADEDIVADEIGSEAGVRTVIAVGARLNQLSELIADTERKIVAQENAQSECEEILESLREQQEQELVQADQLEMGIQKAEEMLIDTQNALKKLYEEQELLDLQYQDSLHKSRTIRARRQIWPGTVLRIEDQELVVQDSMGPATVVKYSEGLQVFPYRELNESSKRQESK